MKTPIALPLLGLSLLLAPLTARAVVSEPDNVLYGAITLSNQPVTSARIDIIVEARRTVNGPAIARYRMGSTLRLGNFYALRIPVESAPVTSPDVSQTGDNLVIVVSDLSGRRIEATYRVADRGSVQRLDLGSSVPDSDGDGLPDSWEFANFGHLNSGPNTLAVNGQSARYNYLTGSDPNNANSLFRVTLQPSGSQLLVSFFARQSAGVGYEGAARYYSLESSTNTLGPWNGLAGYTNLLGNNQTITYQTPLPTTPEFYRGRVWLQGP
jgi:hypothetical protein